MKRFDCEKGRVLIYCEGSRFSGRSSVMISGADMIRRFAEAYNGLDDERVGYAKLCRDILGGAPGTALPHCRSEFEIYEDGDILWLGLALDRPEDNDAIKAFLEPLARVCDKFTFCPEMGDFGGRYVVFKGFCCEGGNVKWGSFKFDLAGTGRFDGGSGDSPADARKPKSFSHSGRAIEYRCKVMTGDIKVDWSGRNCELAADDSVNGENDDVADGDVRGADGSADGDAVAGKIIDAAAIMRLMRRLGYSVARSKNGDICWTLDGIVSLIMIAERSRSLSYVCNYTVDAKAWMNALILCNNYNWHSGFGKSFLEHGDDGGRVFYQRTLDLECPVTEVYLAKFFADCATFMKDWKSRVVDNL